MATNLELKARIPSLAHGHACASRCGAAYQGLLRQRDTYFCVPHGRLKLRECEGGEAELISYERDETAAERWSHYRKEGVANSGVITRMLGEACGILVVVEKRRELYLYRNARIHIDAVENLGTYLEFEVMGEPSTESAETMRELREAFGVTEGDVVRCSYSDLILAKRNAPEP